MGGGEKTAIDGGEYIPEAKGFITSTCYNVLTTWAHREVKYATRVTSQRLNLLHAWVLPEDNLIEGIAMGAH